MLNLFQHPFARPQEERAWREWTLKQVQGDEAGWAAYRAAHGAEPLRLHPRQRAGGTLYIGVASDLPKGLHQNRSGALPGFTRRYAVHRLVRFEMFGDMVGAIAREKQLKNWRRDWKLNLIEQDNPGWNDLALDLGFGPCD